MIRTAVLALTFVCGCLALDNGLGLTPPLAYSSWNFFGTSTNETIILGIAAALKSSGLAELGFTQINMDAGYVQHTRDPKTHKLQPWPHKFPHGIRWLSDALHGMGMKIGAYTDLSNHTCGTGPGSYGYYDIDAETFALDWQVDYLKVDYCGHGRTIPIDAKTQYSGWAELRDALNRTGRPIYFSICPHRVVGPPMHGLPGNWDGMIYAPPPEWTKGERHALANSILVEFSNTFDIWYHPPVPEPAPYASGPYGIITNIDSMVSLTNLSFSGAGSWNDADMLEVCNYGKGSGLGNGMTLNEYRAHYAVWAILASPLIISADLRTIEQEHPDCLALLLNKDIIAVNQDPAALAPRLVYQKTNASVGIETSSENIVQQAFSRPLSGNRLAVLLLNRDEHPVEMTVSLVELGLPNTKPLVVYDVIAQQDAGTTMGGVFSADVGKHDVSFVILAY